ncbi:MAG: peptidylprolyl isomerase [Clostridia bacterium]|nr:peptidylprolyl isomerase [Clostridia bacterium]
MKMLNRLLAAVMALMLCCVPAFAETATSVDDVLVTVNNVPVTRGEFDEYLANLQSFYSQYYDVTSAEIAPLLNEIALTTLVQFKLMDQKIIDLGLALTDEEKADATQTAREEWEAVINDGMTYYGITDESTEDERAAMLLQILAELESMGYTEEAYIEEAVLNAGYDKLDAEIVKDVTVTDEEVVAHYNELVASDEVAYKNDAAAYENMQSMNNMYLMYGYTDYYIDLYYMPEGYRSVTHILLSADEALLTAYADLQALYEEQQLALEEGTEVTGTLVTAEEIEAARLAIIANVQPTIDEINAKLAEGVAFADLIPQYTADPGMSDAAAIAEGYAVHMDSIAWVTEFRDAAFTVDNIGDVTEPVVTDYGVHILQYTGDIPGGPVELTDDLKEVLRQELLASAQSDVYTDTLNQWMEEAEIVYSDEAKAMLPTETAE